MNWIANFIRGFLLSFNAISTLTKPGLKRYVAFPVLINAVIFIAGFVLLWTYRIGLIEWIYKPYPDDNTWQLILWYFIAIFLFGGIILVAYFLFTPIGCLLASPFNDSLAGKTEQLLSPDEPQEEIPLSAGKFMKTVGKEIAKVILVSVVMTLTFLLNLLPVIGTILFLLCTATLGAFVIALQYLDYPMDRHDFSLLEVAKTITGNLSLCLGFGLGAMLLLMIPFLNLICIPVCVIAATSLFVGLKNEGRIVVANKIAKES